MTFELISGWPFFIVRILAITKFPVEPSGVNPGRQAPSSAAAAYSSVSEKIVSRNPEHS